ncbi:hypothetical protein GOBAR_DD09721 [Gossypium barbadense]|nr:hypothetical protein GOBAR_DD09721 [Gossypium barbadense]
MKEQGVDNASDGLRSFSLLVISSEMASLPRRLSSDSGGDFGHATAGGDAGDESYTYRCLANCKVLAAPDVRPSKF